MNSWNVSTTLYSCWFKEHSTLEKLYDNLEITDMKANLIYRMLLQDEEYGLQEWGTKLQQSRFKSLNTCQEGR